MNKLKELLTINNASILLFLLMFAYGWYQNGANDTDYDLGIVLTAYGILFGKDILNTGIVSINKGKTKVSTASNKATTSTTTTKQGEK